jgi:predicted  nucleic acid-binding Zn-ribbon protein
MPSSHRLAIKKLLDHVTERIDRDEAKLLAVADDDAREKLIEELADLHMRQKELTDALIGNLE